MRTRASAKRKNSPFYGPERFTYQPGSNRYRCPAGEQLNYVGLNVRHRAQAYIGSAKRCGACWQKPQCTSGRYKYLAIHMDERARQRARELANTPEFAYAQRQSKEGRSAVRGTQESDWSASGAPTQIEVRAGTVLLGCGCAEHQATGALPQRTDKPRSIPPCLVEAKEEKTWR